MFKKNNPLIWRYIIDLFEGISLIKSYITLQFLSSYNVLKATVILRDVSQLFDN